MHTLADADALGAAVGVLAGCAAAPVAQLPGTGGAETAFVCSQPIVGPLPVWARTGFA